MHAIHIIMSKQKIEQTTEDKALEDYLDSIRLISNSTASVNAYRTAIIGKPNGFRYFIKERYNCHEVQLAYRIKHGDYDVYKILREYVIFLHKAGIGSGTIRLWFAEVKGYLTDLGVEVYSEKCKQLIKLPKKPRFREKSLTKELIVRILRIVPLKLQTVILVAVASGMRIGEIVELKLSDIDFETRPTTINIRAETTKTREARETFLTKEATQAVKDYLRRYFGWKEGQTNSDIKNVRIFSRTSSCKREQKKTDPQRSSVDLFVHLLANYLTKIPELNEKNENGRRKIHWHAFRKYFYTVISDVAGRNFAEGLMGHRFYMDTYYTQPAEKRRKMYLEVEPYLTVSDFTKVEKDLERTTEKQTEMNNELKEIKKKLARIDKRDTRTISFSMH